MSKDKYKDEKYLRLKIEEISVEIKAKQSKLQHLEYQLTKLLLKKEGKPVIDMTAKESEIGNSPLSQPSMKMSGKIDEVHKELFKMEARFQKLQSEEQIFIQEQVEKAAASIIAAVRKDLAKIEETIRHCPCNDEILRAIARIPIGKGKAQEGTSTPPAEPATKPLVTQKEKQKSGWYPENFDLDLALEAFGLKKEKK